MHRAIGHEALERQVLVILGDVIADVVDTEWEVSVDRATTRIGHNVGRELERKREFGREAIREY